MKDKPHLDIHDRAERDAYARRFGVTEERLRKAVRIVGSRISTLRGYLGA